MRVASSLLGLLATASLLAGCGEFSALPMVPSVAVSPTLDADALGGLASSEACHPSVQLAHPTAFALASGSADFVKALASTVAPLRKTLATRLLADATVQQGLVRWDASTSSARLAVLKRVATLEAEVMGCPLPTISTSDGTGDPAMAGLIAYFQPDPQGAGEIVMFPSVIAKGSKYLAVSAVVHEMRHAAQYQRVLDYIDHPSRLDGDALALARGYHDGWQVVESLGGEADLAYGDYVHLNEEFDAFQTGNQVAVLLSNGSFADSGEGFIDTQYNAAGQVDLDLVSLMAKASGVALFKAVNQAQYQSKRTLTPVTRPGGRTSFPGWRGR